MNSDEIDDEPNLCHECIYEPFLKGIVQREGEHVECSYCGTTAPSFAISAVADLVEAAFETHYERTSTSAQGYEYALLADPESDYFWEREGDEIRYAIEDAAAIPDSAAQDILDILSERHYDHESAKMQEECDFDPEAHYERKLHSAASWHAAWAELERSLRVESRFFNRGVLLQLDTIFEGVGQMITSDGESIIVTAGPGTSIPSLHRARVFQSDEKLEEALVDPETHLGSPPSRYAMAGRMNAQGVSVFYGATDDGVALAEVRPPVGSKVLVGQFNIVRPLRLLDLEKLKAIRIEGSIFDPDYKRRIEQGLFLERLSAMITRAVMPDDQLVQYLPTQAVADYLSNSDLKIDGIIFPSAQSGHEGANVVLFHKSSDVVSVPKPRGVEVTAHLYAATDEGPEPDYMVIERLSRVPPPPIYPTGSYMFGEDVKLPESSNQISSLALKRESLTVREINSVEIHASTFGVTRHELTKDPKF